MLCCTPWPWERNVNWYFRSTSQNSQVDRVLKTRHCCTGPWTQVHFLAANSRWFKPESDGLMPQWLLQPHLDSLLVDQHIIARSWDCLWGLYPLHWGLHWVRCRCWWTYRPQIGLLHREPNCSAVGSAPRLQKHKDVQDHYHWVNESYKCSVPGPWKTLSYLRSQSIDIRGVRCDACKSRSEWLWRP